MDYTVFTPNKMIVNDRIYGRFVIKEPVILLLIKSAPLKRLKKISQFGPPDRYYHLKGFSRYEHSLGVMLLLRKLGASLEEQVAGLVHDISHPAFSHVYDWVIGSNSREDFQDNTLEAAISHSSFSILLRKFGYVPKQIADHKNFTLLERKIPDLCADRIDYALRELPREKAKKIATDLTVSGKKIVFKNKKSALIFANNYLERQINHWSSFEAATRYLLLARLIKYCFSRKHLSFADMMRDDEYVVKKLEKLKAPYVVTVLTELKKKSLAHLKKSPHAYKKKFRYVDPEFMEKGKLLRLSDVDKNFLKKSKKQIGKTSKESGSELYNAYLKNSSR